MMPAEKAFPIGEGRGILERRKEYRAMGESEESEIFIDNFVVPDCQEGRSKDFRLVSVSCEDSPNGSDIAEGTSESDLDQKEFSESSNVSSLELSLGKEGKEESGLESASSSWDRTIAEVKEQEELLFSKLQEELRRAHEELKLRDEEVSRLNRIRKEVEAELEDLTANLFQEAHKMVREANMRQACAERQLKESTMQVEVLIAEVSALKTLVLTSTPSRPNPHLHPQLEKDESSSGFFRKHRRSPSHCNLKYGRESSPPSSPTKEGGLEHAVDVSSNQLEFEIDPTVQKEFLAWRQGPTLDKMEPFIARLYREDINHCLEFSNEELSNQVRSGVETGDIFIEAVSDKSKINFPKKCALLESSRQCQYRLRIGDGNVWYYISQICRNRIIAVCDLLNYLRYVERGLVKSSTNDTFIEVIRLRKEVVLARLGIIINS